VQEENNWKEVNCMKLEEVQAKLKEIVMDRLNAEEEQIKPEASFVEDLGADSLDIVELIMGIEEEFDIEIPDEDAEKLTTVGEAMNYVKAKLGVVG
jgi:acyl carrier protein